MTAEASLLATLWSTGAIATSAFAGGVVGNLLASVLYESGKWVCKPLLDEVPDITALITPGSRQFNHDLLRNLRRAECAVLVALCDQSLQEDFGVRTGKGPLVERLRAALHERRNGDVAVLCRIRRTFSRAYADLEAMGGEQLVKLHGTALADVPGLTRAASECSACASEAVMREHVVAKEVVALDRALRGMSLDASHPGNVAPALAPDGLPDRLRGRMERHPGGWWDLLRVAFREELKKPENEKAWKAWQMDVLSFVPQVAAGGGH